MVPEDAEQQIRNVFNYFDQGKLGKLTALDLKRGTSGTGFPMDDKQI